MKYAVMIFVRQLASQSAKRAATKITDMLYRENGQFKTSYRADQQVFPILQDRIAIGLAARVRVRRGAADRARVPVPRDPDPVPDPVAGGAGPEHPGRLLRADLARHRRVHGGRRLRGLQLPGAHRGHAADRIAAARRRLRDRGRRAVRHPEPAHQGPVPGGRDAGGAVLHRLGLPAHQVVHQQLVVGLGQRGGRSRCSACRSTSPVAEVPVLPRLPGRVRAAREEPGARPHRPRVDGDPRHGRGRRGDRHPPGLRQADGVRGELVHRRRGRRAVGLRAPGLVGAGGVLDRPLVPAAVHGHHRRARLDHGQLLRRRLHRRAADRARQPAVLVRHPDRHGARLAPDVHDLRRADRLLPDRRAARPRAAVVDGKEKLRLWPFPH